MEWLTKNTGIHLGIYNSNSCGYLCAHGSIYTVLIFVVNLLVCAFINSFICEMDTMDGYIYKFIDNSRDF